MNTVGIICEYNPFHNGHQKQLDAIRVHFGADTAIVCLMSGNYVQRGAPALFDKAVRARAAVECGADLVLELPITYALRSAEGFADGSVAIFDRLGVDALCFGCECGDSNLIMSTAKMLLTPKFSECLQEELKSGVSFAAARQRALSGLCDASALEKPNDILAVEYCKAILRRNSRMTPFAIRREGDYHGEACDTENPSASFLRRQIEAGQAWEDSVPPTAASLFSAAPRYTLEAGERAVLARLRTLSDEAFEALPYGSEGLWRKLMRSCREQPSIEAILSATKSKRYARTRLQRMLLCAYLGIIADDLKAEAPYVRILAFNDRGRQILHEISSDILLVNAGAQPPNAAYYALECRASDLYSLFCDDDAQMKCRTEQDSRIFYQDLEKNTCNIQSVVLS